MNSEKSKLTGTENEEKQQITLIDIYFDNSDIVCKWLTRWI